jgi:hypothetical protein
MCSSTELYGAGAVAQTQNDIGALNYVVAGTVQGAVGSAGC